VSDNLDASTRIPEDTRPVTIAHRAEFAAFSAVTALGRAMSESAARRAGERLGRLGYAPFGIRRRQAEDNLRHAFPDRDEAWIRATASASYAHLGRETIVTLRLPGRSPAAIRAGANIDGLDAMVRRQKEGRGVVVVTGHVGNWEEAAASIIAHGVPMDGVAQRQGNPLFDREVIRSRETLGLRIIDRSKAGRLVFRSLRQGRVVAFVADQNAGKSGVFVPFFGRLASTHRGPAFIALRAEVPIFTGVSLRRPDGLLDVRLREVHVDRSGEPEEAVRRITAAFTTVIEETVREAAEQYLWQHRRWRTRPPDETALEP
jgi:KDO2-lipid IV(A) lauroyltransferase